MATQAARPDSRLKAARAKMQRSAEAARSFGADGSTSPEAIAQAVAKHLRTGQKHDLTGSPVGNYYSNGGLFSYPFSRPEMFSAVLQPISWFASLPIRESRIQNEVREILTAVTEASGENPETVCGTPPTPGQLMTCRIWMPFGEYYAGSPVIKTTQLGLLDAYGVQERQLVNFPTQENWFVPDILRSEGVNLSSEVAIQLYILATTFARQGVTVEIDGNAALPYNSTELGWIREPNGLSRIIRDGYYDVAGARCEAVDSLVVDWNEAVDATSSASYAGNLPMLLADMYYILMSRGRQVGMPDLRLELLMPEPLFHQLTFVLACTYAFARCGDFTEGTPGTREQAAIEARYNEMKRGQYVLIGGEAVPVSFTSGYDTNMTAPAVDSIYFVPRYGASRELTFLEYFPLNNPVVQEWNRISNTTDRFYTNNGMFAFASRSVGFCDQLLMTTQLRLIVETPFLAGRIDNISFPLVTGFRSPFPGNSSYVNGGTNANFNQFTNQ